MPSIQWRNLPVIVTGWQPATTLTDGLARTVAYYRSNAAQYL